MNPVWEELLRWTPSFAIGFSLNLAISFTAMLTGTVIGWLIACGRYSTHHYIAKTSTMATGIFRNIPSFVFMFYIAFVIPTEFEWQGEAIRFPVWIKAAIALAIPVIGFTSDQCYRLFIERKLNNPVVLPMFFISWTQYFLIIIMASSSASAIGVHEIVGRANTAIAITRDPNLMLWIYLYVAVWFLLAAILINGLLDKATTYIKNHYQSKSQVTETAY